MLFTHYLWHFHYQTIFQQGPARRMSSNVCAWLRPKRRWPCHFWTYPAYDFPMFNSWFDLDTTAPYEGSVLHSLFGSLWEFSLSQSTFRCGLSEKSSKQVESELLLSAMVEHLCDWIPTFPVHWSYSRFFESSLCEASDMHFGLRMKD